MPCLANLRLDESKLKLLAVALFQLPCFRKFFPYKEASNFLSQK